MAKLKLDKESVQGFFFNHTEKIVLAVVLLLLGLFIWSGSNLEGIGAQNPAQLASEVDAVAETIEKATWDNIKDEFTPSLDHLVRKGEGDAVTSESYYRLDTPLIGSPPNSATPRQDPEVFAVTDLEVTVVSGSLAFKAREGLTDPFADLGNMEQKKIEAPKKKRKPKKKSRGDSANGSEGMGANESMMEGMYGEGGEQESVYGAGGPMGMEVGGVAGAAGPSVRADANKFHGYRPNATSTPKGLSVIGRSVHVVSVRGLVPYQQQWDEFERVFANAADYKPSRDIPRYMSFIAERAEVPNDPNEPLTWTRITTTDDSLQMIQRVGFAGFPGEIADSKYLSHGILTMPVPPVMFRDLRELATHSKVQIQEEVKARAAERVGPELMDINDLGKAAAIDATPVTPGARRPGVGATGTGTYGATGGAGMPGAGGAGMPGAGGAGMPGAGGAGMPGAGGAGMPGAGGAGMPGAGGAGMPGAGGAGMAGQSYGEGMGGMNSQLVRGPQAEFLMVRFFDYIQPGKKYVYRVQVEVEDPNHPRNPQAQPQDRDLHDTVRTRLATVAADEAKQAAALKTPIRLFTLKSEWSEPTAPVFVSLKPETYAGGVTIPRLLDIVRSSEPNIGQKTGYSIPAEGEPTADVMNLTWNPKYAIDLPGILTASRGTFFSKPIQANVINPVTLSFKTIPDYPLSSGELVVDLRGGELLEASKDNEQALLTPGEVAVIDASGNFIVRNELDDWHIFDKYAPPPPPIFVEAAGEASDDEIMDYGNMESMLGK